MINDEILKAKVRRATFTREKLQENVEKDKMCAAVNKKILLSSRIHLFCFFVNDICEAFICTTNHN
jgi:hypothetical protein